MRFLVLLALAIALLASPVRLQTTGTPGINDYTIGGLIPGSTSCNSLTFTGGGPTVFQVSASAPGLPYFLFATLGPPGSTCCRPCYLPLNPSSCLIPFTACGGSNQSLDIVIGGTCIWNPPISGVTGAGGIGTMTINLPPGIQFGTQAGIFDPLCNGGSLPLTLTQSYMVNT